MAEETGTDTETTSTETKTPDTSSTTTTETAQEAQAKADAEATRQAALTPEQRAAEAATREEEKKALLGKGNKSEEAKTADAPLDYTALKLPEGYSQDPQDPVFGEAVKLFGEHKIAPDVAQRLIDFTVTRDKAMVEALNEQNAANWQKQVDGWKADSTKEFSAEILGEAKTALPQVFDAETVKWMEGLGLTNHPGLIRGMAKVAKAIKDDTWTAGNASRRNGSDARGMYPNSNMNP